MLWFKAWRESRPRFLICAGIVAAICILGVLLEGPAREQLGSRLVPNSYVGYVYRLTYAGTVRGLFSLFASVLGLGGLQRERGLGTAAFTLILPVTRFRLILVRVGMGIVQIGAISLLPAAIIPALSRVTHQVYPLSQALQFSLLWFVCGIAGFAAWFLASTLFGSDFTAVTVCVASGFLLGVASQLSSLGAYLPSGNYVMSGFKMSYLDPQTDLLTGALPWRILLQISLQAAILMALAVRVTEKRDF
ncbi:MAG TPA: hypothetical protein VH639_28470 [Bryobacteraceae bacterium]|jgi:ABC-type transport system involved in multi-copper enzyme maturation permease subunit